jgi:signal transduction histidine kinase
MAGEHVVFPEIQYNAGITGCRGKLSWARTLAYPIHNDDGKLARVIVMIEDVAEKKTAEEQKKNLERQLIHSQKMEAVGALASGVAHDFNNILQGLSGYIRTAGSHARDEGLSRTLREMDRLIERAADLVRDLLTFGHQVKPETKSLDLNEEIRQAVRMLDRTLPKMIHVDTRLAPDLPKVSGDPRQMTQVILNLAANARDAMPTGGELTFETTTLAVAEALPGGIPAGDYVVLKVTDTGQGMDEKLLPHIFTPFFTTKKPGKGTGLGLSTVFGIVKAHGGFMTCESQPDRGTQFAIHLPDRAVETSAAQAAALSASEAPPGQGETILLVDDEEFIRTTAAEFLEDGGYQVITASCGEDALEACRTRPDRPDLVMLDYSMPGMGGRKCLERLVRIYPGIRVLVASGYASRDVETDLIDLGARGFVPKPYRMGELMVVIRRILDE